MHTPRRNRTVHQTLLRSITIRVIVSMSWTSRPPPVAPPEPEPPDSASQPTPMKKMLAAAIHRIAFTNRRCFMFIQGQFRTPSFCTVTMGRYTCNHSD